MSRRRLFGSVAGEVVRPSATRGPIVIGGRSSRSGIVATVFGGSSSLGRYVVNALGRIGSQVVVPYRGEENAVRHLKVMGDLGQIVPLKWDPRNLSSIERAVQGSSVVINLIGAQVPTSNFSLDDANRKLARLLARVSKEQGAGKFVHVSDLRADVNSPSEYARLKAVAETEVLERFPEATIVRPAPLFGPEDKLTNAYGIMLRYWPVVPLFNADYEMSPVFYGDVAKAVVRIVRDAGAELDGRVVEVVGPDRYSHRELCEKIAELVVQTGRYRPVSLPARLAEPVLRVAGRLPRFRPMFTFEEMRMRQGRAAVASAGDARVAYVEKGGETVYTSGLLWLRRFREAVSMNQVVGERHTYDEFFDTDGDGRRDDNLALKSKH